MKWTSAFDASVMTTVQDHHHCDCQQEEQYSSALLLIVSTPSLFRNLNPLGGFFNDSRAKWEKEIPIGIELH